MIALAMGLWIAVVGAGGRYAYKHNGDCVLGACNEMQMIAELNAPRPAVENAETFDGLPDTHWASNVVR